MKSIELFNTDDERAVSPVIGVILMVAITVILAAVIGTFVLGLSEQVGKTGPRASIGISDADATVESADGQNVFTLSHNSGDPLTGSQMKVLVQQDGSTVATDSNLQDANFDGTTLVWSSGNTEITAGEVLVAEEASGTTFSSGQYTIKLIHEPTGTVVASQEITIN